MATSNRAKGGNARAASLSPEKRSQIAQKAARARHGLLKATHGSADHPLKIGDIEIPCYVLEDGTRVLSQRGFISGVGMSQGSSRTGDARHIAFLETEAIKPHANKDLLPMLRNPIRFQNPHGGGVAFGYPATVLADFCDAVLAARRAGDLPSRQASVAEQCEILVRGFARVGIIALVDEATGYEKDRVAGSLAKILEAFIAKELRPWVKTFPSDYYEQLFRLRGLSYSSESVKRPQYFGVLTNDIVYKRLAPGVLDELKKVTERDVDGRPKTKYFQRLTANVGYPKLREHLGSVVTLMKLSGNYADFKNKLETIHPKHGTTMTMQLGYEPDEDEGEGI